MEALNQEGEYYKAIKYYNYNNKFFSETNYLNNLKLDLSKSITLDEKFSLSFPILEFLVEKFESGKIKQSHNGFVPNEMDIADLVYNYYYVCFKLSKYQTIINTQRKPEFKNIKFPELTKIITYSYFNLKQKKKNMACKYLESEYLTGNENARELIKEICK